MNLYTLADALPDLNIPTLEANKPTNVYTRDLPTQLIPDLSMFCDKMDIRNVHVSTFLWWDGCYYVFACTMKFDSYM